MLHCAKIFFKLEQIQRNVAYGQFPVTVILQAIFIIINNFIDNRKIIRTGFALFLAQASDDLCSNHVSNL